MVFYFVDLVCLLCAFASARDSYAPLLMYPSFIVFIYLCLVVVLMWFDAIERAHAMCASASAMAMIRFVVQLSNI